MAEFWLMQPGGCCLLYYKGTLLVSGQPVVQQDPHLLFSKATSQKSQPPSGAGVTLSQGKDFAFAFVELHEAPVSHISSLARSP